MAKSDDWYQNTADGERGMYANIDAKIDGYAAKCPFLTAPYQARIIVG